MNVLAIMGSPRKGHCTDKLVDAALDGVAAVKPGAQRRKVLLDEMDIRHCRNCLTCRDSGAVPYAPCVIKDGMSELYPVIEAADVLIVGTPVHMGSATALTLSFLERICWTFAKPGGRVLTVSGCPIPRTAKRRTAMIIVVSGVVPPLYRWFCDDATALIRSTLRDSLNCTTLCDMYAGAAERKGIDGYLRRAREMGSDLARRTP